jgi:hypothetical protein
VVVGEVETMSRLLLCFDTSTIGGTLFEIQSGKNGKASGWEMKKVVSKVYGKANVSCSSPDDLDSLLHYFDWDSCGDSLFDMGFISFDESALLQ